MDEGYAKLAVAERILEQLALIDKAKDNEELQTAIQEMLQVIGNYTKADRVFLFEKKDEEGQSAADRGYGHAELDAHFFQG